MAGAGWRQFTRETLASADVQQYLMDQAVMRFASASERTTELVTPTAGMVSYRHDVGRWEARTPSSAGADTGGAWKGLGHHWGAVSGALPTPVAGNLATPQPGDTVYAVNWRCNAVVTGQTSPTWRQIDVAHVASLAERDSWSAQAATDGVPLYEGFQVLVEDLDRLYVRQSDATWRLVGGKAGAAVTLTTGTGAPQTGWTGTGYTGVLQHHGNGMATVYAEVVRSGASLTPSTAGAVAQTNVLLLPAGWEARTATVLTSGIAGRGAHGHMSSGSRTLTLTAVTGTAAIATGDTISLGATYALANPQDLNA